MVQQENYIGEKYGRLTIQNFSENLFNKNGKYKHLLTMVNCKCDCGNNHLVRLTLLKNQRIQSCGCYRSEIVSKQNKDNRKPFKDVLIKSIFNDYKQSSKRRTLEFNLTASEFAQLINQNCFYCGDTPSLIRKHRYYPNDFILYNGIDRIDNKKGYIFDNCVSCCDFCNKSKHCNSTQFFLNKIKKIYIKHYGIN